jgi:hypothetical protein
LLARLEVGSKRPPALLNQARQIVRERLNIHRPKIDWDRRRRLLFLRLLGGRSLVCQPLLRRFL